MHAKLPEWFPILHGTLSLNLNRKPKPTPTSPLTPRDSLWPIKDTYRHVPPAPPPSYYYPIAGSQVPLATQPHTNFFTLPLELRQRIYALALGNLALDLDFSTKRDDQGYEHWQVACTRAKGMFNFAKTCRLAYVDTLPTLYSTPTFISTSPLTLPILPSFISPPSLSLLTSLYLKFLYTSTPQRGCTAVSLGPKKSNPQRKHRRFAKYHGSGGNRYEYEDEDDVRPVLDLAGDKEWKANLAVLRRLAGLRWVHVDVLLQDRGVWAVDEREVLKGLAEVRRGLRAEGVVMHVWGNWERDGVVPGTEVDGSGSGSGNRGLEFWRGDEGRESCFYGCLVERWRGE